MSIIEPADTTNEQVSIASPFVSYAQNFEDIVLWRALSHVTDGTYVDVGAADPTDDSVTAAFYERGWSGVDVEPVPAFADALRKARPRDVVVELGLGAEPGVAVLHIVEGTGWSTFDRTAPTVSAGHGYSSSDIEVRVSTLDRMLSELGFDDGRPIHFLKIDVEGYEGAVLQGSNLARWKPWVAVIEATAPGTTEQTHGEWEDLVLEAGYQFCLFDGLNRFYVHREHLDLAPRLSYPVSIFDQPFVRREATQLVNELTAAQVERSRLGSEVERLVGEVGRHAAEAVRLVSEVTRHAGEAERLRGLLDERAVEVDQLRRNLLDLRADQRSLASDIIRWRNEVLIGRTRLTEIRLARDRLDADYRGSMQQSANLQAELDAVHGTFSWRVTKPLRALRRVRRGPSASVSAVDTATPVGVDPSARPSRGPDSGYAEAFLDRLRQVAELLHVQDDGFSDFSLEGLQRVLAASAESDLTKAWLCVVAATARYPDEESVRDEARRLHRDGPELFVRHLTELFESAVGEGRASAVRLDVIDHGVAIDITHTAQHDLQTGIQRVVRETCSRWLDNDRTVAVWWDYGTNVLRRLDETEADRFRNWREHMPATHGTDMTIRTLDHTPTAVVVPWKSILLLPELTAEPARTGGYRALSCAHVLHGISMIGYDIIPVTAAETVTEGMSHVFSLYLSMVKRSSRLSAISGAAANDFRAFNDALPSQGLTGPVVRAHLLPPSPAELSDSDVEHVRASLALGALPMVLVVGSHEPRKNHLTVLDAAERLWSNEVWFDLVFIGGSGWGSDRFDREVERLISIGRPLKVLKRATEHELWAAYRLARFSVFPSLLEGYGLPIVESIASGTPVITTNYGSMAEVAVDGGALLIDPYDAGAIETAMRSLLEDNSLLGRLREEARRRTFSTWDQYASDVWRFLVDDAWTVVDE